MTDTPVQPASTPTQPIPSTPPVQPMLQAPPQLQKKGFLEEEPGRKSAMRAMSIIALIASITFGFITLLYPTADKQSGVFITFGFLLAAFAPKALQKFAETNARGAL